MKLVSKVIVVFVILGLFSLVSPVIKASAGELVSNASADTSQAVATVVESGGFNDTWESFTKLVDNVVAEATSGAEK